VNRHDSRQWDAQNNINVYRQEYRQEYRREGSTVRLLHRDLEEIRQDLEAKNERLQKENKQLREENRQLKSMYQETATALLEDIPRHNCEGCQLALREGEQLYDSVGDLLIGRQE